MSHCPAPFLIIEPFNHFGTDPVTLAATGSFNSFVLDTIGYNWIINQLSGIEGLPVREPTIRLSSYESGLTLGEGSQDLMAEAL